MDLVEMQMSCEERVCILAAGASEQWVMLHRSAATARLKQKWADGLVAVEGQR